MKKRLLLVGWDSADWKIIRPLMARGEMPMLAKILAEGAHGDLTTLEPSLSPMLWTTIATGRHAAEHGVHGFTEVRDGKIRPVSAATRACRAVWNILSENGLTTNLIGWFATQGERDPNVRMVSNLYPHAPKKKIEQPSDWPPAPPGTYFPDDLAAALDPLRVHPTALDGNLMRMFIPRLGEIDQDKDKRPYMLAEHLAEAFSIQAAATWLMARRPADLTMIYFRAIDEICHRFMPFHPPRMDGASEEDFALYHDVVNSAYRVHDLMLTRLVDLAGPDAAVILISDHGFHSDHLRPRFVPNIPAGIVAWHRSQGIFAAAGPGLRPQADVFGARLPDITPTILHYFGLPRARDMEGRVLIDAFASSDLVPEIATWEISARPASAATAFDDDQNEALIDHFVALGYMDAAANAGGGAGARLTELTNRSQLAIALMHSDRNEEALPLLEELFAACLTAPTSASASPPASCGSNFLPKRTKPSRWSPATLKTKTPSASFAPTSPSNAAILLLRWTCSNRSRPTGPAPSACASNSPAPSSMPAAGATPKRKRAQWLSAILTTPPPGPFSPAVCCIRNTMKKLPRPRSPPSISSSIVPSRTSCSARPSPASENFPKPPPLSPTASNSTPA